MICCTCRTVTCWNGKEENAVSPAASGDVPEAYDSAEWTDPSANRVHPVRFGHSNIYFIETASGHILVDAGMPNRDEKLDAALTESQIDPRSVQLIIATHGHLDHVGSIAYAREVSGGKVLCHRSFAGGLENGKAEKAVPKNLKGRLLNLLTGLMGSKFDGLHADILIDDEFDLADYGISGKVIHTPGHSPSSISIILDSGEALVGDLVRGVMPGDIGFGMFYEDKAMLLESLEKVAAYEPRIIYLSHGTHIDNSTLREVIEANK
jgi:glyoxylase-like metal-dependent hydrolase (beta-lactamase superfamily II)